MAQQENRQGREFLFSKMPVMLHSTGADGRLSNANDYWLETLGYERNEVIGKEATQFLTPHARAYAETTCLPVFFKTGSVRNEELQFLTKSGRTIDVLLSAIAERDSSDRLIRSISISIDVTERKRLDTLLDQARRQIESHDGHIRSLLAQLTAAKQQEQECRRQASDLCDSVAQSLPMARINLQQTTSHADTRENGKIVRIFGSTKDAASEIALQEGQLEEEISELREEIRTVQGFELIVGNSEALRRCFDLVARVAPTDANVLILGETGTGKELVAHSLHELSTRKGQRMVSVNCAALPADLIESELFGHEKGAFTGAESRRPGRFELADKGTLFLDEIGDLPLEMQAKLLRVIQEGTFERLGGNKTLHIDVRLIAATNRQLKSAVDRGDFRADLYYRINTFPIEVPSLSERREDIPLLAEHFVRKHAPLLGKEINSITGSMLRHLRERPWPGNVRELESFIMRSLITATGSVLRIVEQEEDDFLNLADEPGVPNKDEMSLHHVERDHVLEVLDQCRWIIEGEYGAASLLGVPPSTLRSKMKRLGVRRPA